MATHVERRHLPYTARQLFDLVADVERYPEFLNQFAATRIRRRDGNVLQVDQVVRYAMVRMEFVSTAVLDPPREIVVTTSDPRFRRFEHRWRFFPAPNGGSIVELISTVELRGGMIERLARAVCDERSLAQSTILAFKRRARALYGMPIPSVPVTA